MEEYVRLDISSEDEMASLAEKVAAKAEARDVITLNGNLGAGKTVFCRAFVRYFLGSDQNVVSPTFTLVQTYPASRFCIWHFDLYRLRNESDLYELGIDDAFAEGVSLLEWPDLARNFINPDFHTEIKIEITGDDSRRVDISGRLGRLLSL